MSDEYEIFPKPTIQELEDILSDNREMVIEILPNGEVKAFRRTAPACGFGVEEIAIARSGNTFY